MTFLPFKKEAGVTRNPKKFKVDVCHRVIDSFYHIKKADHFIFIVMCMCKM
jgi:hypothetical protein